METGITAVLSMSAMFWMRIKKICVMPQKAERPRMERRTMGWRQVAAKLRLGERNLSEPWVTPALMQNPAMLVMTLKPR